MQQFINDKDKIVTDAIDGAIAASGGALTRPLTGRRDLARGGPASVCASALAAAPGARLAGLC